MEKSRNILGTEKISRLVFKFSTPAAISMVIGSLYNMVDQLFIGKGIGLLGNTATNIAFPLTSLSVAVAMLFGIGGAANYNIRSGAGKEEEGKRFLGCALSMLVLVGIGMMGFVLIFLNPLLTFFGATAESMDYAMTYSGIISIGFPAFVLSSGGQHLVRADRSPVYSMACGITGAVINTILDPIFIFKLNFSIAGAAWATVIGQYASGFLIVLYFAKLSNVKLKATHFFKNFKLVFRIMALGLGGTIFNLSVAVTQIVMNNVLKYYGALSEYGENIPLAVVGIVSKINFICTSICIGIHQGCQPIFGYNYGARNYDRVKKTYRMAILLSVVAGTVFFLAFELFPRNIISWFSDGTEGELYYQFATGYFRIFLITTPISGIAMITSGLFTAMGKVKHAILIPLVKQLFTLVPLIVILPMIGGINAVLFAGPLSDGISFAYAMVVIVLAFRKLGKE